MSINVSFIYSLSTGEKACMKRCISLHSYNHYFWYSLALAYSKASESKGSFDFSNQNEKIPNTEHYTIAVEVAEALEHNKTTNDKDSLKIYINCSHCKCLAEMNLGEKPLTKVTDQKEFEKEEIKNEGQEERPFDSDNENGSTPLIDEIVIFTKCLSINNEIGVIPCNLSKSTDEIQTGQSSFDDLCRCPKNALSASSLKSDAAVTNFSEEDQRHCSFSVKLKPSKCYQRQKELLDKMALKYQQNLFAFFCFMRAR
jgi:hypothetical protein